MPYSENTSISSFGVIDYNDLDMTFTQDTSPNEQNVDNFKFSLQSIDDSELDDFRRSLVTPMSVNNIQDPMYAEFEKSKQFHKKYILSNQVRRQTTLSPTHSYAGSIADSLAVFNRLIEDHHSSDDLVQGDLKDFMSPYSMDDLISLPQSRSPTTPSPQIGRATVTRYNTMAPIGSKGNHSNLPAVIENTNYLKPRKVSIDASVQTPSRFDSSTVVSPKHTNSKERYNNHKNLKQEPIKTLQPKQTDKRRWSSYVPEKSEKTTSKLQQLGNRNRLSTIVHKSNIEPIEKKKGSNLTQLNRAPLLSGVESRPENKRNSNLNVHNNRNSLRNNSREELHPIHVPNTTNSRLVPTNITRPVPTATTSRHVPNTTTARHVPNTTAARHASTATTVRHVRHIEPVVPSNNTPKPYEQHHHDEATSEMYLQRRLSLMVDNDEQQQQQQQQQQQNVVVEKKRDAPISRYSYRRLSTRTKPVEQPTERSIFSPRNKVAEPAHDIVPKPTKTDQRIFSSRTRAVNDTVSKPEKSDRRGIFTSRSKVIDTNHAKDDITKPIKSDQPQRTLFIPRNLLTENKPIESDQPQRTVFTPRNRLTETKSIKDIALTSKIEQHKHGSDETPRRVTYKDPTTIKPSYSVSKRLSSSDLPSLSLPSSSIPAPSIPTSSIPASTSRVLPTVSTQLRRARSLTVPSSRYGYRESDTNVSSMPVPVFRHRKQTSKYEPVPENQIAPVTKEVRFSFSSRRSSNEIQPIASDSTGRYSNTTTSSSRSDDIDSTPSTPPIHYVDTRFDRRRSIPIKEDRVKSSYLNKPKDTYDLSNYRRQRVVSEDNHQYKGQQRKCVTESAREVLAQVQERRARNAIILNKIQHK